jgi:hypothetical protein
MVSLAKVKNLYKTGRRVKGKRGKSRSLFPFAFPLFPTSAISLILWSVLLSENGLSIALESHIVPLTL